MDPWSMDPLSGLGPWTPSMDQVHEPPPWGCIFPNFNISVKHDSSFQFLKNILVVLKHTFVLNSKPHLHSSVFFILKRGLLTTYHDKSIHHVNNSSVTDLQSWSMITAYEIKETTASKVLK